MGKPKKLPYQLILREEVIISGQPYELLDSVREEHHFDTAKAKIALAWKKGTKPDVDGRLVLGRCHKLTDLQRELVDLDFVISLNKEIWGDPEFDREKKIALLDHEMCHAARAVDGDGDPMIDTKARPVWRLRGHDIEEFRDVVARHGCYKGDLQKFAQALLDRKKSPLFAENGAVVAKLAGDADFLAAAAKVAAPVLNDGITSVTLSMSGMEPVVIDKPAAQRIHERARRAVNKKNKRNKK